MRTTWYARIAGIIAASVAVTVAGGWAGAAPPASGKQQPGSAADVRITKFHLVEMKDGKTLWEVWGDRGEIFEKGDVAKVTKISSPVTVTLYSEHGKLTARSDSARVNMRTKDIRLDGNVTATSEQGNTLHTQSLDWSAKNHRVFTRLPVTLTKGGLASWGVGMEAETDLERATFLSRVRSHVASGSVKFETKTPSTVQQGGIQ